MYTCECECGDTHYSHAARMFCEADLEADDRAARRTPPRDTKRERYYLSED